MDRPFWKIIGLSEVIRHFGLAYPKHRRVRIVPQTLSMYFNSILILLTKTYRESAVREMPLVFGTNINEEEILMGTTDIQEEIRRTNFGAVSAVASVPAVRRFLIELQRWTINHAVNGIVAEGRDITTVVAPDADARILPNRIGRGAHGTPWTREHRKSGESGDLTQQISERDTQDSKVNNLWKPLPV